MKIRTDFVTNSSSSSFIVGFTPNDDIAEVVDREVFEYVSAKHYKEAVNTLCSDIMNSDNLSVDDVLRIVREEAEDNSEWYVEERYSRTHRCTFREAAEYARSPEGQREAKEYVEKRIADIKGRFNDRSVFAEVSYSDHTDIGCELEHHILPECSFTVACFSHH